MALIALLRRFLSRRDGNVAVIFALATVPLLAFAGTAVDYGLATRLSVKLQAATDATALALCKTPIGTTTAQLQAQAAIAVTAYMNPTPVVVDPVVVTLNPRMVLLTTHAGATTYFSAFTSVVAPQIKASAQCATPVPKTFEIALVLDTTGSMGESSGGTTKIQALQQAATNFVNYVHNNAAFASGTRLAIVPFAASVAVDPTTYRYATWIDQNGKSAYHWTNVSSPAAAGFTSRFDIFTSLQKAKSNWGWGGCLEKLPYPLNVQDGSPTTDPNSLYVPLFAPDEPGGGSATLVSDGGSYSTNSYIDDYTTSSNCTAQSSATFFAKESRACKYVGPGTPSYTTTAYGSSGGISIGQNGPNYGCNSQPLLRLTSSLSAQTTLINKLTAAGMTDIHEGLMWGWRTLSPNSVFADGAAYSSTTVNKIMILMTDGTNEWLPNGYAPNGSLYYSTGYYQNADGSTPNLRLPSGNQNVSNQSQARNAIDALTSMACTNAKAAGISIYTIAFSVPSDPIDSQGITLLKNCATSPGQAFVANDSNSLIAAFGQIGNSIGSLRLSR